MPFFLVILTRPDPHCLITTARREIFSGYGPRHALDFILVAFQSGYWIEDSSVISLPDTNSFIKTTGSQVSSGWRPRNRSYRTLVCVGQVDFCWPLVLYKGNKNHLYTLVKHKNSCSVRGLHNTLPSSVQRIIFVSLPQDARIVPAGFHFTLQTRSSWPFSLWTSSKDAIRKSQLRVRCRSSLQLCPLSSPGLKRKPSLQIKVKHSELQ